MPEVHIFGEVNGGTLRGLPDELLVHCGIALEGSPHALRLDTSTQDAVEMTMSCKLKVRYYLHDQRISAGERFCPLEPPT